MDAILDALRAAGHDLVEATPQPDDALVAVHEPDLLEFLRTASDRWAAGPYRDLVGQERVVPYLFPTPAMTAGLPARPAVAVHADAGRFAYDTMTLVGPGTWEAARAAADCAVQAAGLVTGGARLAYALCRPPGHHATPAGLRRLLLPQQRGGRRGRAPDVRSAARRHRGHRRPPGQRHGLDLLRASRRALRLGARRPGGRLVPARRGVRRRDRRRRRARAPPATCRSPRAPATNRGWPRSPSSPQWVTDAGCDHLVVSLGVDAPRTTRRARCRSPRTATARRAGCSARPGCRRSRSRRAATTWPRSAALVAAYLDGHASA